MKLRKITQKKGAMELSMGTIVILVLAMSMLILGLVLIKTIFTGAKQNVSTINDKVKDEIGKLFVEDKKIVVYLADNKAEIPQGEDWGVAFGVKNILRNTQEAPKIKYEVSMDESSCKIKEKEAMSYIVLGKEGDITMAPGDQKVWLIRFEIPEGTPLCKVRYNIEVSADGDFYTSESFDVSVEA